MKAIVIGSGFGGLGAANRLASKGYDVEIFEKRDQLGGRAYQYHINGFKFDGGPTVITAPYMFDELFNLAGKNREEYIELLPLDPFYRIFNHEGRSFDYRHQLEDTLKEIERWNPDDREGYVRFTEQTKAIFERFHPYTDLPIMTVPDMLKIVPDMIRLKGFFGTYGFASQYIKDPFSETGFLIPPAAGGWQPLRYPLHLHPDRPV